ncbi:MAG: hypothetical protein ACE5K8_10720, partial [Candidatus Zixiibacteriota bacterium]
MQQLGIVPAMGRMDFSWGAPSPVTGDPGNPTANLALALQFSEEVWNQQNLEVMDEIADTSLVVHHPLAPAANIEMAKHGIDMFLAAFLDFHVIDDDAFV